MTHHCRKDTGRHEACGLSRFQIGDGEGVMVQEIQGHSGDGWQLGEKINRKSRASNRIIDVVPFRYVLWQLINPCPLRSKSGNSSLSKTQPPWVSFGMS